MPLAPDGGRPISGGSEEEDRLRDELAGSMFDAAIDAAAGRFWLRYSQSYSDAGARSVGWDVEDREGGDRYRSTQERQLAWAQELVGVSQHHSVALRDEVADLLGVERMLLEEQVKLGGQKAGLVSRGEAVCAVLRAMPGRMRYERLLASGRVVGLWGEAHYWDSNSGNLRRMPFRICRTRAPPRG